MLQTFGLGTVEYQNLDACSAQRIIDKGSTIFHMCRYDLTNQPNQRLYKR